MAIYYLGMKTFSRAGGKSGSRATSGAAYRAGERIRDERTGAVYDHRRRQDVLHKEIVLPTDLHASGAELDWARNRSMLWNAAEHAEARKNARVAREFTVALPHELAAEQRSRLARRFAQELADRYRNAVDVALHEPRGDPRNFHAHLLATTREVTPQGLGPKTTLELSGTERHRRGLPRWAEEVTSIRERWAVLTNEALREAHIEARVVYLSRAARAASPATPRLPLAAYHMERRGERSFIADHIRERHRAEMARGGLERSEQRERSVAPAFLARAGAAMLKQFRVQAQAAWAALRGRFRDAGIAERSSPVAQPERARIVDSAGAYREREPEGRMIQSDDVAREAARRWLAYHQEGPQNPAENSHDPPERHGVHGRDSDLGL